jgi:ABC-type sugar transport system substrate-binding protein
MKEGSKRSRLGTLLVAALLTLVVALAAAGCGGGGSSSSSGGGSETSESSGGGSEAGGEEGGGSEGGSSLVAEATEATPSKFEGPTEPAKAPSGINLTVVTCNSALSGCTSPAEGLEKVGKVLGWNVTVLDGAGDPSKMNADILSGISSGADVIATTAIDPNLIQQGLKAAKKAGIPVVAGSNGIDSPNPVKKPEGSKLGYAFDVAPNYAALGEKVAKWVDGESNGEANLALFSDKEFPSVLAVEVGLLKGLEACEGCTVSEPQYFTGTQVGAPLEQQTAGYLRSNPETDYLFSPYDPAAAIQVPAIEKAGLSNDVQVIGVLGSQQNLEFIRQEQVQAADAAYDNNYMAWAIADQTIRLLDGQKLAEPHGENLPYVVLDKENLPEEGQNWEAEFPYEKEFEALWGLK